MRPYTAHSLYFTWERGDYEQAARNTVLAMLTLMVVWLTRRKVFFYQIANAFADGFAVDWRVPLGL